MSLIESSRSPDLIPALSTAAHPALNAHEGMVSLIKSSVSPDLIPALSAAAYPALNACQNAANDLNNVCVVFFQTPTSGKSSSRTQRM